MLQALLLACLCALSGSLPGDELDEARVGFVRALKGDDAAERSAALAALVGTGDARAGEPIVTEFLRCVTTLRRSRADSLKLRVRLARGEETLAQLRLRAERDESLASVVAENEEALEELREKLERVAGKVAREAPWREALAGGFGELLDALGSSKRRKTDKALWDRAEDDPDHDARLGAIELLGDVGLAGTAVGLQKLIAEGATKAARLRKQLPELEKDVRTIERRLQKEAVELDGRTTKSTAAQYEQVKAEAATVRRAITALGEVGDVCVAAAGEALRREGEAAQSKSVMTLQRAFEKAKDGARLRTLGILAQVPDEPVKAHLHELLETEKDPAAVGQLLIDLARLGDEGLEPILLERFVADENWHVQSKALEALVTLRSKAAIPILISRLDVAQGRVRTDTRNALVSLTALNFRANVELWRRWWADEGEAFVVPTVEVVAQAAEDAKDEYGVSFFGITTESQRVLFVLDLSGSMNFSMIARDNPSDDPGRSPDLPRDGEESRLTAAKRHLAKAVGGLQEDALFNLVVYASDVSTYWDDLVAMDVEVRVALLDYVKSLTAVGGTNIYGALQAAFELAGVTGGDEWSAPSIDTIFFVSDGKASVGMTTDPDEILAYVSELNGSAGVVVHTIGLSGAQDAYLLRNLAEQNGGSYAAF